MNLVMTAKAIGLDPVAFLRDVLIRFSREADAAQLAPHGWRASYAEQVMHEHEAAIARLAEN